MPVLPLCASWPWPHHIPCSLEARDITVGERNREQDRQSVSQHALMGCTAGTLGLPSHGEAPTGSA